VELDIGGMVCVKNDSKHRSRKEWTVRMVMIRDGKDV
jgi:hypothetical protein